MIAPTNRRCRRCGMSLIEVIAGTILVTFMIVPIAGVIRASAQSISLSSGDLTTEARLRTSLRWLGQTVRDSEVLSLSRRRLILRLADRSVASIQVRRGNLEMHHKGQSTVLAANVRDIQFEPIHRRSPPVIRTGMVISLRARDDEGRGWTTVQNTVCEPPQI